MFRIGLTLTVLGELLTWSIPLAWTAPATSPNYRLGRTPHHGRSTVPLAPCLETAAYAALTPVPDHQQHVPSATRLHSTNSSPPVLTSAAAAQFFTGPSLSRPEHTPGPQRPEVAGSNPTTWPNRPKQRSAPQHAPTQEETRGEYPPTERPQSVPRRPPLHTSAFGPSSSRPLSRCT